MAIANMKPEKMFVMHNNQYIFPFESTKHKTKCFSIYDKIVLHRLDVEFPVLIKLDKKNLGGGQAVLRFGLAITEDIMNSVFLSGGFGCVRQRSL